MTHVTLIAGTYQPKRCGVAHYTEHLRAALNERGVQSVVITTYDAAQTVCDSSVIGVLRDWSLPNLLPLVRSLQNIRTDILHIQHAAGTYSFERGIFLLPLLLRMLGWRKPIVTTVHEYGWWEWQPSFIPPQMMEWLKTWGQRRGWWDREDGFLLTLSDAIVTTNSDAESVIYTRLPELRDRVYRIPIAANVEVNPVAKDYARQLLRQTCNWSNDVAVVVFFGFLHPVKGLETLLTAFKQVVSVQPQARLLLIGGVESLALVGEQATQYWDKLHKLVFELNLNEVVHFSGYLPADTASLYIAGADVGVLPFNCGVTVKSGSLLTLMAHGLPVVATFHNSNKSVPKTFGAIIRLPELSLADEQIVQLVEPRDVNSLATALIELLANPTRRIQLGDAGCNFVRNFDWQAISKAHLEVYQTVVQRQEV